MKEKVAITPEKEFQLIYYRGFYWEVASRLGHRVMYDHQRIHIKNLPIGGHEKLDEIKTFLPKIKKCFQRGIKSDLSVPGRKNDLFVNENPNILLDTDSRSSLAVNHALLTLGHLGSIRIVNYQILGVNKDFYFTGDESFWNSSVSTRNVVETFNELHHSTSQMLCSRDGVSFERELRAAHFFAAGLAIFDSILPKQKYVRPNNDNLCIN